MEESNSSDSLEVIEMNGESNENEENVQEDDISSTTDVMEQFLRTKEEAQKCIMERVECLLNDPEHNPLLAAKIETMECTKKMSLKLEELEKVFKAMEVLYRCQVKFLQHQGLMAKPGSKSVGVGIDLPILAEAMSSILQKPGSLRGSNVGASKSSTKQPSGPVECIDLTDDMDITDSAATGSAINNPSSSNAKPTKHPAPLPLLPGEEIADSLQKPQLKIKVNSKGIVLTWDMTEDRNVDVDGYDVFYYQEQSQVQVTSSLWKKLVRVLPLPLPMSCFLSHLEAGHKYHFAVRAAKDNPGPFSNVASAMFVNKN